MSGQISVVDQEIMVGVQLPELAVYDIEMLIREKVGYLQTHEKLVILAKIPWQPGHALPYLYRLRPQDDVSSGESCWLEGPAP